MSTAAARFELRSILLGKSVKTGDFTLASGAKSNLYVDCRVTTFDSRGAVLVGQLMHEMVRSEQAKLGVAVDAIGGLTLGADPISLSTAMTSSIAGDAPPIRCFVVRKEAKGHGRGKRIEGNFNAGDSVVVAEDVITTGDSTLKAIAAIEEEGGKIAFVAVLVDREEGGKAKIEEKGYPVVALFKRSELVDV
ncbi:MAG: orotate phosphoribosyltransferase [Verrucomicrobiaceae bacterium]|nr:orotate phosphoribosyltransferase [Verrucomicrobiaceae bacterium]